MSNSNSFAVISKLIAIHKNAAAVKNVGLFIALKDQQGLDKLLFNIRAAADERDQDKAKESTRAACLAYWSSSKEGASMAARHEYLKNLDKTDSLELQQEFSDSTLLQNKVNISLVRAAKAYEGISILRKAGFIIDIAKVKNHETYLCTVARKNAKAERVRFTSEALMRVAGADFTKDTSLVDLVKACAKVTPPNDVKGGNGDHIAPSKVGEAVASVDTSVAAITLAAIPPKGRAELFALWARLDAEMTDADKAKARKDYAKEADTSSAAAA